MSNSLDPYQVRTECQPDLSPNCLKGLSADDNVMSFADPESFVRGGPNLIQVFFSVMRGYRIQIRLYMGHHLPASETPFKWRFAGWPVMAQH